MFDGAAGVSTCVDRNSGIDSLADGFHPVSMQMTHVGCVGGELGVGLGCDGREGLNVDQGRDESDPTLGHGGDGLVSQSGAVLDAVDACVDELGRSLLGEAVGRDTGAEFMSTIDCFLRDVSRPQRCQVPLSTVDPVTDELDPAVTCSSLTIHLGDEVFRGDLGCVVADVALGTSDVTSGADDSRQVVAIVNPMGVTRGPSVADEEGAGPRLGASLVLSRLLVDGTMAVQPDVVVSVNQARDDPTTVGEGASAWQWPLDKNAVVNP